MSHTTVMYGGAPMPRPAQEQPDWIKKLQEPRPMVATPTDAPHRLRVCVLVDDDGAIKLKVIIDGKLVSEVEGARSLTLETNVGGGA
jgi:hypothetical protein